MPIKSPMLKSNGAHTSACAVILNSNILDTGNYVYTMMLHYFTGDSEMLISKNVAVCNQSHSCTSLETRLQ